jgi:hypothetical protein
MRVLALVQASYDTSPSQRFRIEQWEPHLRPLGIEIDYLPFLNGEGARLLSQPGRVLARGRSSPGTPSSAIMRRATMTG